jgi:lactate dehydrogenase-like 2-hydroxyacid dehydrogenase
MVAQPFEIKWGWKGMTAIENTNGKSPLVMMLCDCDAKTMQLLRENFELTPGVFDGFELQSSTVERASIQGLVTRGDIGANRHVIEAIENLSIIACYGVGIDAIDVAFARERGIVVTNTPDVLTDDVADIAIGLVLALMRDIIGSHAFVKSGRWKVASRSLVRRFYGSKVGIVGFGRVGSSVAKRAAAFDGKIGYFDFASRNVADATFFPNLIDLAAWADVLVVTLAGGDATNGIINREVLTALGSSGFVVNVSRGSVIDEVALLDALEGHHIAGAGLDVFWNEPGIDERYLHLDNVVLQPHHASATVETREAMGRLVVDNLAAHFKGLPLLTPV